MVENTLMGSLHDTPFSQLLFNIWHQERSGCLKIRRDKERTEIFFESGNLVVTNTPSLEKRAFKTLKEKQVLNKIQLEQCKSHAAQKKISLVRALLELQMLPPPRLWKLLEALQAQKFFHVFDWDSGNYEFFQTLKAPGPSVLDIVFSPNFILQGIRQMRNESLIELFLPAEDESLRIFSPEYKELLDLQPHEHYLLSVIKNLSLTGKIYDCSELGRKETQKVLFGFMSVQLVGLEEGSNKEKDIQEFSLKEHERIISSFNEKCSTIFKYVTKEIGPVAMNVISKCLEDIKPGLGPLFQKIEVKSDGCLDMIFPLRSGVHSWKEENKKALIQGLNEILAAEVLTVKRTLGNEHESALVKSLEKIGNSL